MLDFISKTLTKFFGTKSDKDLKTIMPLVQAIQDEYARLQGISDDELRAKTAEIREHIRQHLSQTDSQLAELQARLAANPDMPVAEKEGLFQQTDQLEQERNKSLEEVLMQVLPLAFAVVKETARRYKENGRLVVKATDFDRTIATQKSNVSIEGDQAIWQGKWLVAGNEMVWDMVHYDVQLIGGIVLHQGKISEMATGEGKTLVATLPSYLNALADRGVHIVTVNDYLARRDSEWMAPLMEFHGITVDCIDKYTPNSEPRRNAYRAGITYGTNNEFGFDYLRDNMARTVEEQVQRRHHYAMVDEVDSVLVDDARTPLIISGPMGKDDSAQGFYDLKPRVVKLVEAQRQIVTKFLNEAKRAIEAGQDDDGGLALLRAHRGLPKYKPLIKYLSETGIRQKLQKTEGVYLQDNQKLMPQADKPLYFTIDERNNTVDLTTLGLEMLTVEGEDASFFVLPDVSTSLGAIDRNTSLSDHEKLLQKEALMREYSIKSQRIHTINQLLKAYTLFEREVDYIIVDNKVKIVDEQTGRVLDGRRYSDGLHQALEAKENVHVEEATQTYATITLQNYFRMYHKLAGMTGTAETEATELWEIYKLDVVVIPTNRNVVRKDHEDKIYKTVREKYNAVVQEIQEMVAQGRPVLVGTTSVENSEILSRMLSIRKIPHQVLNAKQHAKEAEIVAKAGLPGTVTIATNMAGRGTDIKLTPESRAAGGLAIIGTERHESRRVDRQLRGRAGRQGDPGSSQFFVSLEDNLMRLFGSERVAKVMDTLGMEEGEVIQHPIITRSIQNSQRKVEENNFSIRKRLLEYDDVMNKQRQIIYKRRKNALDGQRLQLDLIDSFLRVAQDIAQKTQGDYEGFKINVLSVFGIDTQIPADVFARTKPEETAKRLYTEAWQVYQERGKRILELIMPQLLHVHEQSQGQIGDIFILFTNGIMQMQVIASMNKVIGSQGRELIKNLEQSITLAVIDQLWKEHLRDMDDLKQQVQNAVYEQKDPLLVYKFEAVELFRGMIAAINQEIVSFLGKVELAVSDAPQEEEQPRVMMGEATRPRRAPRPKLQENRQDEAEAPAAPQARNAAPSSAPPREKVLPIISQKTYNRNDRVTVRYADGSVKKDVKYKSVEEDILSNRCVVLD